MEASAVKNKSFTQPRSIADLLPGLSGILTKDDMQTLTAKKAPRPTMVQPRTIEKVVKPLTIAEMRADIRALQPMSPRRNAHMSQSNKKKGWNSSVKLDKKISHTSNGQMKNTAVRKVLNFQQKPKAPVNVRMTIQSTETPKFPKPEFRPKKSVHIQAKNTLRISGICNIPQTPVETQKPIQQKSRLTPSNKENNSYQINKKIMNRKTLAPPTPVHTIRKFIVTDTPLSNTSWKSGSDASFLQKEKEINDVEDRINAISAEQTLEKIAEVSPPMSTPFKEYRSVQEYFNNSSVENSAMYSDNTIMCFDKPSVSIENNKREESVIVSLCDLFNKAAVTNTEKDKSSTGLDHLLQEELQIEQNIKMIDSGIQTLKKIKETQLKSLENIRKSIEERRRGCTKSENEKDKTMIAKTPKAGSPSKSPIISRPCSVIKSNSKSPTYKIPKKNLCLRKKILCKSMPNVSGTLTPVKDFEGRALTMYMKMKEQMNFLSTPSVNRTMLVPDTPGLTSHNLQKQLDKLYGS